MSRRDEALARLAQELQVPAQLLNLYPPAANHWTAVADAEQDWRERAWLHYQKIIDEVSLDFANWWAQFHPVPLVAPAELVARCYEVPCQPWPEDDAPAHRPLTLDELREVLQALEHAAVDIRYRNRTPAGAKVEASLPAAIVDQLTDPEGPAYVQWLAARDIILKPVKNVDVSGTDVPFLVNIEGAFVMDQEPFTLL
jgi:hypothetical protein